MKTEYPIIIGGENFGCGSSREHAPVALGASGARAGLCRHTVLLMDEWHGMGCRRPGMLCHAAVLGAGCAWGMFFRVLRTQHGLRTPTLKEGASGWVNEQHAQYSRRTG
jgi:hypothetical protein